MQTRSGVRYPRPENLVAVKRKTNGQDPRQILRRKRSRPSPAAPDLFDGLPDDLVMCILCQLSSSASSPSDLVSVLLTCKRWNRFGLDRMVLSKVSTKALGIRAKNWCEEAHRFFRRCAIAGNLEACYILGMIKFYCLKKRIGGAMLLARAAKGGHAEALYSLSMIQFNGSGGSKNNKNLCAGVALCARSAFLGHVDALRELGFCLLDGYGIPRNVHEGRRFLIQANTRELIRSGSSSDPNPNPNPNPVTVSDSMSHSGSRAPVQVHPANRFLVEWFGMKRGVESGFDGLRMCSNAGCGRPETRRSEFRRCSVCCRINYCSRACQAVDWKYVHKLECRPNFEVVNDVILFL